MSSAHYHVLLLCLAIIASPGSSRPNQSSCNPGFYCTSAGSCLTRASEALFPCGDDLYCCLGSTPTTKPQLITAKTTNKPTTVTTTTTTYKPPKKPSIWSDIPARLQPKVNLLPKSCGNPVLNDRIANGHDADVGQFPWMALIGGLVNGKKFFWCGGSIINSKYILTAAHCTTLIKNPPTIVRLGEWQISNDSDCIMKGEEEVCADPVVDMGIASIKKHEQFGNIRLPSLKNDIALIRLNKSITFTKFINPLCLTPKKEKPRNYYTISGWGIKDAEAGTGADILQYAVVNLFDFKECSSLAPGEVKPLDESQFCANGYNDEEACKGDSGGPLTYEQDLITYQKGIVSSGTSTQCDDGGKPVIYTEVSHYIYWILENIQM